MVRNVFFWTTFEFGQIRIARVLTGMVRVDQKELNGQMKEFGDIRAVKGSSLLFAVI